MVPPLLCDRGITCICTESVNIVVADRTKRDFRRSYTERFSLTEFRCTNFDAWTQENDQMTAIEKIQNQNEIAFEIGTKISCVFVRTMRANGKAKHVHHHNVYLVDISFFGFVRVLCDIFSTASQQRIRYSPSTTVTTMTTSSTIVTAAASDDKPPQ